MNQRDEWVNEVWADICSERRIKLLFQDVERKNGVARGIYNRSAPDARPWRRRSPSEAQRRRKALIPGGWYSAY